MFEHVILDKEQVELLERLVEAVRSTPREQREKFLLIKTLGSTKLHHPGLRGKDASVYEGDLEILADTGLLICSYGSRGTPMFDVTPTGFRYYEHVKVQIGEQLTAVTTSTIDYLGTQEFMTRYPAAHKKWQEASNLLWNADSERQFTTIGHLCREATQEFAETLILNHKPDGTFDDKAKTVARIRAVLRSKDDVAGTTTAAVLEALIVLWGVTCDLVQRQEHGAQKEGSALNWEDGRRIVFCTAFTMAEIDRALT